MIRDEVKRSVDALGKTERVELEAYLRAKNLSEDPNYREEIESRANQMGEGQRVSAAEIKHINDTLSQQGL